MLAHVLVAYDGSEGSRHALQFARRLITQTQAKLTLVQAVELPVPVVIGPFDGYVTLGDMPTTEQLQEAERKLRALVVDLPPSQSPLVVHPQAPQPAADNLPSESPRSMSSHPDQLPRAAARAGDSPRRRQSVSPGASPEAATLVWQHVSRFPRRPAPRPPAVAPPADVREPHQRAVKCGPRQAHLPGWRFVAFDETSRRWTSTQAFAVVSERRCAPVEKATRRAPSSLAAAAHVAPEPETPPASPPTPLPHCPSAVTPNRKPIRHDARSLDAGRPHHDNVGRRGGNRNQTLKTTGHSENSFGKHGSTYFFSKSGRPGTQPRSWPTLHPFPAPGRFLRLLHFDVTVACQSNSDRQSL